MLQDRRIKAFAIILLVVLGTSLPRVHADVLYKKYVLQKDRGEDILCDAYVVQKNDWVLKLFRQKGELSQTNFLEFLQIFKRLNPSVHDVNIIRPGQKILIPLKKVRPNQYPPQPDGTVSIPFVTLASQAQPAAPSPEMAYTVKPGDCVSVLLTTRFGRMHSESYQDALRRFKKLNPQKTNLDLLIIGETIRLPAFKDIPKSTAPAIASATLKKPPGPKKAGIATAPSPPKKALSQPDWLKHLKTASDLLLGSLHMRGRYFLPGESAQKRYALNLADFPVIGFSDGMRIIVCQKSRPLPQVVSERLQKRKEMSVATLPDNADIFKVMDALVKARVAHPPPPVTIHDGPVTVQIKAHWMVPNRTPEKGGIRHICVQPVTRTQNKLNDAMVRYLAAHGIDFNHLELDGPYHRSAPTGNGESALKIVENAILLGPSSHHAFLSDVTARLGFPVIRDAQIHLPGIIQATDLKADMIMRPGGQPLVIDQGDFNDRQIRALTKGGFSAIRLTDETNPYRSIEKILQIIGISFSQAPNFLAKMGKITPVVELSVPGLLVDAPENARTLLTAAPLHPEMIRHIRHQGVRIIMTPKPTAFIHSQKGPK